ncbi:hypothetical protein [Pararobbsia alpina]|uniref:DUF3108 domain-containing protein n=1 Tax=Pararobbsia alpina TaxID=621374 RepID=A0A6S7CGI9_9BURK|nr:hypothetical protein [Pararobbsia alpina]CAB3789419.1 hypothetical protein LMG28138_02766 [Pararobbsia alpina]
MKYFGRFLLAVFAVSLSMHSACAEETAAPRYRIGDAWSFVSVDALSPARNIRFTETITHRTPDGADLRVDDAAGHTWQKALDADGNTVRSLNYLPNPTDRRLKFPMSVGMRWTVDYDLGPLHFTFNRQVVGFEEVQTRAGTFKAYRIEGSGTVKSAGQTSSGEVTETSWYAPAAKRIVKDDWHSKIQDRLPAQVHIELVQMLIAKSGEAR